MDTVRLTVFRAVATLGSFTSAAKSLRYTQSAVSRQIAALEDDLAVALFDREARGVRLTEEDVARRELATLRAVDGGRLRIGAFATAEAALVPKAMVAFQKDFPNVELSLSDGLSATLATSLRTGELDVAVVNHGPAVDGLPTHHLLDDPQFVALPPDHRLAHRKTLRLTELAGENWIAGSTTVEDTLIGACLRSGFRPTVRYVVREWTAKQGLVAAGLGVTLVPGLLTGAVRPDIVLTRLRSPDMTPRKVVAVVTDRAVAHRFLPYLKESAEAVLMACRAGG
jgi:DNA-binding transcriptional LysR family regulator